MARYSSPAKHMFYYLLSLVALGFAAVGIGQIIVQIINASLPETTYLYDSGFEPWSLRFGISSSIVTVPIFFYLNYRIQRELSQKILNSDSAIRKWLTYLILFVSSLVVIGVLINFLDNFLQGELTTKFLLKIVTALIIAGSIFSFYLYDIKRDRFGADPVVKAFAFGFWIVAMSTIIAGLFFTDSPSKIRAIREDDERMQRLQSLQYEIQNHFNLENTLPKTFDDLKTKPLSSTFFDPVTDEPFEYRILPKNRFELCAKFQFSNKEDATPQPKAVRYHPPYDGLWLHDGGRDCFEFPIEKRVKNIP